MHSPDLTHRMSRYSYTSTASLTPSNVELWFCDDLDCNPPYGPLCAACRPKCAELQEARADTESVSTYRPDSPAVSRPKKSKDNLFDPDVYLDEVEEEDDDAKRLVEYLELGVNKLTIPEADQVRKDARASVGLQGCLERSRHYLKHHRGSVANFRTKLRERQAIAGQTLPQLPQIEETQTTAWPQAQEEEIEPQEYTRIPETDASEAATQFLYQGQEQNSAIIEDVYPGPFSNLIQAEEDEDEIVMETMHREWLHKWLHGLREGPFAAEEFDDASSTRTSLYGPLTRFEEYAENRLYTAVPEPARVQVDERVICKSCKRCFDTYPDPPELHLMKCEYAYKEAARLQAYRERQRENWLKDRNRSLNTKILKNFRD